MFGKARAAAVSLAVLTVVAGCADSADSPRAASPARPSVQVAVQPDDKGEGLISLLRSATTSIDIVIYQIGNPDVEYALFDAMARGVRVRLIHDGDESNAASGFRLVKRMRSQMESRSIPKNRFDPHWSNNNFSLTHQKSVLIDATDSEGSSLSAAQMPTTARLLISTGNFLDGWFGKYYTARDFYVTVTDTALIDAASKVFASDFGCADRSTTNGLRSTSNGLVWSNGTTDKYAPSKANPAGTYPGWIEGYYARLKPGKRVDQGNSFSTLIGLIRNANEGDVLRVYSEELDSPELIAALRQAAKPTTSGGQGANVRIVMTFKTSHGRIPDFVKTLESLAADGANVTLMASQEKFKDSLYIHAKIVALERNDGTTAAFVGSENLTDASLLYNRELGILLSDADRAAITELVAAFDSDFARRTHTTQLSPSKPRNIPPSWIPNGGRAPGSGDDDNGPTLSHPRQRCGPITTE